MNKSLEGRIEALERRLSVREPTFPRVVCVFVHGGAFRGETYYAWADKDMAGMIARGPDETLEAFDKRACALVPDGEGTRAYHAAPRLEEWGAGEKDPAVIAHIQAMG